MKIEWSSNYEFVETPPGPVPDWALKELAEELTRLKVNIDVRLLGVPDAFPDGDGVFIRKTKSGWSITAREGVDLAPRSLRVRSTQLTSICGAGCRTRTPGTRTLVGCHDADTSDYVCSPIADNSSVGELPRLRYGRQCADQHGNQCGRTSFKGQD